MNAKICRVIKFSYDNSHEFNCKYDKFVQIHPKFLSWYRNSSCFWTSQTDFNAIHQLLERNSNFIFLRMSFLSHTLPYFSHNRSHIGNKISPSTLNEDTKRLFHSFYYLSQYVLLTLLKFNTLNKCIFLVNSYLEMKGN